MRAKMPRWHHGWKCRCTVLSPKHAGSLFHWQPVHRRKIMLVNTGCRSTRRCPLGWTG
jgi:hypothetical protein